MPFSDLFKKSPKKEPEPTVASLAAKPSTDPSFLSPEMQKKRSEAATEFLKIFQEKLPLVGGEPHAGTVLAVAARLAGSSLYRALNDKKEIAPGVIVLSDEVNAAWPQLMNLFAAYCKQNGIDVLSKPMITKFPEQNTPLMDVEQILAEYQDQYHEVMKKHGLDYLNGARAGMIVCSVCFQYHYKTAKDIDPFVAAGIVAMGIVEGAKTAPPRLKSTDKTETNDGQHAQLKEWLWKLAEASIRGSGDRLVLGEQDAAIMEALNTGGKFLDLGAEAEQTWQGAKIKPHVIYEMAMFVEIKNKISEISFVGVNVDQLLLEWRGKSQEKAPVYVRQAFWLRENGNRLGYTQSGNSWVRK